MMSMDEEMAGGICHEDPMAGTGGLIHLVSLVPHLGTVIP